MPSMKHEGLLQPFQNRPSLAAELLVDALGVKLPAWRQAQLFPAELTDPVPTEFRADTVVAHYHGVPPSPSARAKNPSAGRPAHAVIVEVQLRRDRRKRYAWPAYLATLRARMRCPTTLLVVCPDATVADWCADPIQLGHPDWVLAPLVLGPDQTPVVTDPAQARRTPELAVLSALAHGDDPRQRRVLDTLLEGLQAVDRDRADIYHDVVAAVLPEAARRYLEGLMSTTTYKFQSEFALRHIGRGKVEGKAEDVLTVLAARGVEVPEDARHQITTCTDLEQLDTWLRRAVTAGSVDEVFAG